ncbi:YwqJ-related putative deaminase [Nocardiopsis sp. ARC36]
MVPWEEWGERPGYVIGTAALNIVAMVGGAALTATGVGAVVGVPLMAWRGMAIVDGMGGRGGGSDSGSGTDVDVDLPAGIPNYGGLNSPIASLDASSFDRGDYSPAQWTELQTHLDRWASASDSGGGSSDPGGRPGAPGGSGRPAQPRNDRDEQDPARPVDPTAQQLADSEAFWDIVDQPDLAEVDRAADRDNRQRIEEVARESQTDPNGPRGSEEGLWTAAELLDGPEGAGDRVPAGVGGRGDDTLTAERDAPVPPPDRTVNLTDIGDQSPPHRPQDGAENNRGAYAQDRNPVSTNMDGDKPTRPGNGSDDDTPPRSEDDRTSQQKAEPSSARREAESHTAPGTDSPGMYEAATPTIDTDLPADKGDQSADVPDGEMPDNKSETNPTSDQLPEGEWSRSINDSYPRETLENLPEPNRTPMAPDGQRQQIPVDLTRGSILEELDMSRVELDDDGLISRVDGRDLTHFLLERLQQREIDIKNLTDGKKRPKILIDQSSLSKNLSGKSPLETATLTQISRADLGGRKGGVYSLVIDRRTGAIAEGFNGRTSSVQIKPSELHPALKARMDKMEEEGGYPDQDGNEMSHPHWDNPLRHAEVKAINELLLARRDARISDFQLDNRFIFKDGTSQGSNNNPQSPPSEPKTEQEVEEKKKAPCCANCSRMTDGAPSPRMRKLWYLAGDPRNDLPRRST